ncbi:glutathione S-transferase family protein [Nocardia sp. 004]|uniref:glutathione S-transferase family protein n=1 Tax=Nocardia sp. 004 TaxID=3385978 RepID=UPI0039A0D4EA
MSDRYKLYVSDVSYFSGKFEAYLRYKGIPHERIQVNIETTRNVLLPATGFMKIPAMQCPDGSWLKDTTPMIQWLDRKHPVYPVYPEDPAARFLALLVEDYADEWMWRPAMYYRWRFADSARLLRARIGREFSRGTRHLAPIVSAYFHCRQYLVFVYGDGVRRHNEAAVQDVYLRTLRQLSDVLASRRFLLGARPSIVDFAFFGSMFRHFALDPVSAEIMIDTAPAVYAWTARLWNARGERDGDGELDDFSSAEWDSVFASIAEEYLPYLDRNAEAYTRGERHFDLRLGAARYPRMRVVRYRVACREQLLKQYAALDESTKDIVRQRLSCSDIAHWLDTSGIVDSGLSKEFEMPLAHRYPAPRGLYWLKTNLGTPWDMPKPPIT